MKLIALLIGLLVERLATQLFHLRELRWLDRVIDAGCDRVQQLPNWPAIIPVVLLAVLLALPIFLVTFLLADVLFGFLYLLLAVLVLFFSLGPKDIGEDIDDYCAAVEQQDAERIRTTAKALLEHDVPEDNMERIVRVEGAVFSQANNRLFAVIFWFVLLGPLGAWSYRVTDLVRRRAVFKSQRDETSEARRETAAAAARLHGWLAYIPARLTAFGYALAGSFDAAKAAWRGAADATPARADGQSESLLARVGLAAMALPAVPDETEEQRTVRGAAAANSLVFRLLLLWAVIIAGLTLYGWSV